MRALLLAGVIAIACVGLAEAAPITATYDFNASFASGPNAIISGSVSLTYTPHIQNPATVDTFLSTALQNYTPVSAYEDAGGSLTLGTNPGYATISIDPTKNSFGTGFIVNGLGDVTTAGSFYYVADGNTYIAASQTVVREASDIPEPASLALLGTGLAGVAAVRRRHTSA